MIKVVIDPGHGGSSTVGGSSANNATGPTGLLEKSVTLQVAKAAEAAFENDAVSVILTRTRDVNLGIAARAAKAKDIIADVFESIHFNAPESTSPPAQGTETWIGDPSTSRSRRLAEKVQRAAVAEDKIFQALADPSRRAIFESLTRGEAAVRDLTARFDISQPAISQHLKALRDAGLVRDRREGRARIYSLDARPLAHVHDWLAHYERFWSVKLDALEALLAREAMKKGKR